jgi:hypothetical protein
MRFRVSGQARGRGCLLAGMPRSPQGEARPGQAALTALTLRDAARMLDQAVVDGTWRDFPLGRDVDKFLRHMATEFSAASIADYRSTLARLAVEHAHLELRDFDGGRGAELLEDFLHRRYRDRSPMTRKKVRAHCAPFSGGRGTSTGSSTIRQTV